MVGQALRPAFPFRNRRILSVTAMLRFSIALLAATACFAQPPAQPPKTAPELAHAIIEDAHATPIEIFANVVLQWNLLASLPEIDQIQALDDVFYRAGEARDPVHLRYYGLPAHLTAREGNRAAVFGAALDALSIRCRAVRLMLKLDAKKAREMFEAMPRPDEPKGDCSQDFIPDAGIYFETLAAVASSDGFTEEQRAKQAPFLMVERGARSAGSSWDVIAAAKNLASLAHNEKEAGAFESALAASLAIDDSDRPFTNAVRYGFLVHTVLTAREALQKKGAPGTAILEALRGYLARHLTAARCRENEAEADSHDYEVEEFDNALGDRTDIAPIGDGLKPSQLEDTTAAEDYANAADYAALRDQEIAIAYFAVNAGPTGARIGMTGTSPLSDLDSVFPASNADAQFRAQQLLYKIDDFAAAPGQDPLEIFHQKCALLRSLLGAPLDSDTERAVNRQAIAVLEDPVILVRSPVEWLNEYQSLFSARWMRDTYNTDVVSRLRGASTLEGYPTVKDPGLNDPLIHSSLLPISLYGRIAAFRAEHDAPPAPPR
jgi:hypothetical protein